MAHGDSLDLQAFRGYVLPVSPVKGRARGMPDRTVISSESRSLTDTPHQQPPGMGQVRPLGSRSLQAGGPPECDGKPC
jgi:hypothetical protein